MTLLARMQIIFRVDESRIGLLRGVDRLMQQRMNIDDLPTSRTLRDKPSTVGFHHAVIVDRILRAIVGSIKRRGDDDNLCTSTNAGETQLDDAILEGQLTRSIERLIDAIVNPIAGDDQRRLELREHAAEALMQIRTREAAAGVARLGKTRSRLARETHVHDCCPTHALLSTNRGLDIHRPVAAVRDAIAEEENAGLEFVG